MARTFSEFGGDITPPRVVVEGSPEAPYIDIVMAAGMADQSALRCPGFSIFDGTAGVDTVVFPASAMTGVGFADDGFASVVIPVGFADAAALAKLSNSDGIRPQMEDRQPGPLILNASISTMTLVIPANIGEVSANYDVPAAELNLLGGNLFVTKTGNSLVCFVAWDATGGITVTKVEFDTGTFTLVETLTCGANKLGIYVLKNQTKTNLLIRQPLVAVTFSAIPSHFIMVGCEIRDGVADPSDIAVSATATDAFPSTAASAETAAVNETMLAVMLVNGTALATAPVDPEGFTQLVAKVGDHTETVSLHSGTLSLYVWRKNVIELTNLGLASTLPESRAWAAGLYSFQ